MGVPIIELTELAIPGHLGQVVGFTSYDRYRPQWSHSLLRHENEKKMQINEQERLRANFVSLIFLYKNRLQAVTINES